MSRTIEVSDDDESLIVDALRAYEDDEPFADELYEETRGEYADRLAEVIQQ